MRLCFFFWGELKKGLGVGWFVIWWFGLFWVCFFFTNQQLTVTADQSVGWDVWVFFQKGRALGGGVFPSRSSRKLSGHPTNSKSTQRASDEPLALSSLRVVPWLELFTKGLGPNKYPRDIRCIWGWLLRVPSQGYHHFSYEWKLFGDERLVQQWWVDQWIMVGVFFGCFHYHKRVQ